ncbi:hypothetical protein BD626DRAFT_457089 [Schizophyllum amplum]|uniref:MYND-type domain-containing protein n=1 Tax=Schizophyllum amplum TaxID=97359 RepID=A0A550CFR2_9AGAR|nr:hypothetical protein BD626DRAFT_457089 [Auriculariopsis ampla]
MVIRLSKFQTELETLIKENAPHESLSLPAELLHHRLFKELFARLHPSRIPKHPIDHRGAQNITDALQAFKMYSHLGEIAPQSGKFFLHTYLAHLPNAWQWGLFLLPGEGNVTDAPGKNLETLNFPLREDGTVAVGVHLRYYMLAVLIAGFADAPEGRKLLLAQPRFMEILLAVAMFDWSCPSVFHEARETHVLMRTINDFLADKKDTVLRQRMLDEVLLFEQRSPGRIFRVIIDRTYWILDAPHEESFQFFMGYMGTLSHLLILSHHVFRESARRANGGPLCVRLLLRTIPDYGVHRTRLDERMTTPILMQMLETLLTSRWSDREVVAVIKAGLLQFFDRLNRFVPMKDEGAKWRKMATVCIKDVLLPSLIWPKVLRAFHKEASEANLLSGMIIVPQWNEWGALLDRCTVLMKRYTTFRQRIAGLQVYCYNPNCANRFAGPSNVKNKICVCAKVCYCSKNCQKAHWRQEHRTQCSRDASYPLVYMPAFEPENPPPLPRLRHTQRHFIKTCALHDMARDTPDWLNGNTILADYSGVEDCRLGFTPAKFSGDTGPPLEPGTTRVFARVNWGARIGADIAVEMAIPVAMLKLMDERAGRRPGIFSRPL